MPHKPPDGFWRKGCRCALVDATPMRPGRGRKSSHNQGRRIESPTALLEFEEKVAAIVGGIRSGELGPSDARQRIRETGVDEFVRIAESCGELDDAVATFNNLGYHLWDVEDLDGVLRVRFTSRKQLT
jgi:hypothetical protein